MEISSWILLPFVGALGFYLGHRWSETKSIVGSQEDTADFSLAYLESVNLLLNERGDDAIETLLPLLERHPEMAETHFSLARVFRKRGEFDHAIRVHEHLLKQADNPAQRQQAVLELAQDYLKAGLLDRAEHAFQAVLQNQPDDLTALRALAELFEMQQDWTQAISIRERMVALGHAEQKPIISILYCEIAEAGLLQGDLQEASRALRMAYESDSESSRGTLLAGQLAFSAGQLDQALAIWRALLDSRPDVFGLILNDFLSAVDCLGDSELQREIRLQLVYGKLPRHFSSNIADWIARQTDLEQAVDYLYQQARSDVAIPEDLKALLRIFQNSRVSVPDTRICQDMEAFVDLLPEAGIVYQCCHCGYQSSVHYWKCPGCRHWDTMRSQGV